MIERQSMKQSKLESGIESGANTASGFIISWAMWVWVVQPLYDSGTIVHAFWITCIFTVTSLLRSYVWRRFFNQGLHRSVHALVKRLYKGK